MEDYLKRFANDYTYVHWNMRNDYSYSSEIVERVLLDDNYLKSDISKSYALNTYGLPHPFLGEETLPISYFKNKKTKKVLPYISFIQHQYHLVTQKCKIGIYFSIEYMTFVYINTNAGAGVYENECQPVPDDAFLLAKAFTHIQNTKTIPEYLIRYIEKQMALDMLKG